MDLDLGLMKSFRCGKGFGTSNGIISSTVTDARQFNFGLRLDFQDHAEMPCPVIPVNAARYATVSFQAMLLLAGALFSAESWRARYEAGLRLLDQGKYLEA